jgi:hypothetical protein
LQFLAPTGTFFLAVFVYHEPFTRNHLITFALIWIALAIFTGEAVMQWRRRSAPRLAMPITQLARLPSETASCRFVLPEASATLHCRFDDEKRRF